MEIENNVDGCHKNPSLKKKTKKQNTCARLTRLEIGDDTKVTGTFFPSPSIEPVSPWNPTQSRRSVWRMTQNKDAGGGNGNAPADVQLKIVVVGDGGCGKTSLLMVYAKDYFPEKYAPTVFEKFTTSVVLKGKEVKLNVYDTAGQEDYDRLRPLSYQEAHLILLCFDVTNPTSFDNVTIKWHPEVKHFCPDVPVILIGCKTDLRKDKECTRKLKTLNQAPVTYTQGVAAQQRTNAELYLECSAKFQENVDDVFSEAAKTALAFRRKRKHYKKKRHCAIV
ncbi:rho-related GTP-binding protein RhoF isoform X2 [Syngnathoides biaculeatus]|uniref:rho-related GTP-binding protein RhoF isoform X2 n=1 Tax=Syngnathoides biaculeatus TaxID=300417 RepID=UPI002ADD8C25|nr:rho-related GTP-binding protein RhoF isoform X2 [Syngnathoides biaculeatus]